MASQYDDFWKSRLDLLQQLVTAASEGHPAETDVNEIRQLGKRTSWSGSAVVQGKRLIGEQKRGRESFLDRVGLDAIDAMAKCRDDLVLQPVA